MGRDLVGIVVGSLWCYWVVVKVEFVFYFRL